MHEHVHVQTHASSATPSSSSMRTCTVVCCFMLESRSRCPRPRLQVLRRQPHSRRLGPVHTSKTRIGPPQSSRRRSSCLAPRAARVRAVTSCPAPRTTRPRPTPANRTTSMRGSGGCHRSEPRRRRAVPYDCRLHDSRGRNAHSSARPRQSRRAAIHGVVARDPRSSRPSESRGAPQ